ncbi:hypothetical protein VP01_4311g2 [Puccinia sorghi]|uniref:Uncharacterized protein n=1 Tax=Puccinia sorghi TaxID=27349 RepID=A0A0L6US23_9BASI|nr:hypothetical protein VP01_4311g2 [Puccinia sorghi]
MDEAEEVKNSAGLDNSSVMNYVDIGGEAQENLVKQMNSPPLLMESLKIQMKWLRVSRGLPKRMNMLSASEDLRRTRKIFLNVTGVADQNQQKCNTCKTLKLTCIIGCPFSCVVYFQKKKYVWKVSVLNSSNNNPPSSNPAANVINQKLDNKTQQEVQQLANSGPNPPKSSKRQRRLTQE